jgi:hypothetical protein
MAKKKAIRTVKLQKRSRSHEEMRAILDEYVALTEPGAKGQYLKSHGLTHQHIHDFKKRLGMPITHLLHKGKPKRKPAGFAAISPDNPPVTLDEAIHALEIKQDAMKEMIETLRRMRGR